MAVTKHPARSIDKMGNGDMAALVKELDESIKDAWSSMRYYQKRLKEVDRSPHKDHYLSDMAFHHHQHLITLLRIREAGLNRTNKLWN